ncbi:MAG: hypothetical protein KatS3mg060_3205 [Dehalococcoidia bacterium]|nr:MAG: hypothetical protein KatS3mg060_3205 [Dehalococcoidia bacterium]
MPKRGAERGSPDGWCDADNHLIAPDIVLDAHDYTVTVAMDDGAAAMSAEPFSAMDPLARSKEPGTLAIERVPSHILQRRVDVLIEFPVVGAS